MLAAPSHVRATIPVRDSVAKLLEEDAELRAEMDAMVARLQTAIHRMVADRVGEHARADGNATEGTLP